MDTFLTSAGVVLLILTALAFYRAVAGPTIIDRIVGVNVIGTKTTIILVITGAIFHRVDMFVDIALAYALLNFIVSIAAAGYFQKHVGGKKTGQLAESGGKS